MVVARRFSKKYLVDLAERVLFTFAQAAGAVILVSGFKVDVIKIALAAGGLAVLKALIARGVGQRESAAVLPEK